MPTAWIDSGRPVQMANALTWGYSHGKQIREQDLTFHNNRIKKLHKLHGVCHNCCQASLANIASLQRSKYRMTFWAGAIAKGCWSRGKSI